MKSREASFERKVNIDALEPLQTRAGMDAATIAEYAEAMAGGVKFPPIEVREIDECGKARMIVTDGIHRMEAARRNGAHTISARVLPGSLASAYRDALAANAGLRRTNADKLHALGVAWENRRIIWPREDGADPSAEVLARACAVSTEYARQFVQSKTGVNPPTVGELKDATTQAAGVNSPTVGGLENVPKMPTRKVFGADGRVRPVRPSMPVRPVRPSAPVLAAPKAPVRPSNAVRIVPDRYGTQIPIEIQGAFEHGERGAVESMLREARKTLSAALDAHAPSCGAVRQDALLLIDQALIFVKAARAHCVCRMCQGNGCKACHNRGWQTEDEYKNNPKEFQAQGGAA